ncbi:hypothetical protein AGMMS4956_19050 [Bacteroidia bacterium]|nr:hypothetical protein AGMMS4956_19050 [Bacteroidia bacterium]
MAIVSFTKEAIKEMPSYTDWKALKNMKDEDIDCSDISEWTDEDFALSTRPGQCVTDKVFAKKEVASIVPVTFYFEPSTIATFRKTGKDWQTRLNNRVETWLKQTASLA